MRNPTAIYHLDKGRHPYEPDHPLLATQPRRLTVRDIGGVSHGPTGDSDGSITADDRVLPPSLRSGRASEQFDCRRLDDQDDPFGFGFSMT